MTVGAQGHPCWVDNHPTTLQFLAASQACLHPEYYATRITEPPCGARSSDTKIEMHMSYREAMETCDDDDDDLHNSSVKVTTALPEISYKTRDSGIVEADNVKLVLKPHIQLAEHFSDYLLDTACRNFPSKVKKTFVSMFKDAKQCSLKNADLKGTEADDECVSYLLEHKLEYLDLRDCKMLTGASWKKIGEKGSSLVSLEVGRTVFPEDDKCITLSNLRHLGFEDVTVYMKNFSPMLVNLVSLNLSSCEIIKDINCLATSRLQTLIIYNCNHSKDWFFVLSKIKSLRHLDISRNKNRMKLYEEPERLLELLVESLPDLCYLDISGTNLATSVRSSVIPCPRCVSSLCYCRVRNNLPYFDRLVDGQGLKCDIGGLGSRTWRPLDVLGLCHTSNDACKFANIPAIKVLGDANEEQILDTVELLMPSREQVTMALNELFHLFRFDKVVNVQRALKLILSAMTHYHYDKHVQISSSASLFYILRSVTEKECVLSAAARQQMVTLLINAMEKFPADDILVRNGCLTFSHLHMPHQVLFEYERLVALLLRLIKDRSTVSSDDNNINHANDMASFACRISIHLLNSLACHVEGYHKRLVGDLGAIETMLDLINDKLASRQVDDILDLAWSVMWNVTDETPDNSRRFLDGRGMEFFMRCHKDFSDHEDLLRNMMGLLGNVAEVKELRSRLLTTDFINTFTKLLHSKSGGIEVSYNAAGVLSHIASDGPNAWSLKVPSREDVLKQLRQAIAKWDINVNRNINYRSFEPILRLLLVEHTKECQLWAVWALANLTRVYPDKYCSLVVEERGVQMLELVMEQRISGSHCVDQKITELARTVISHCHVFQEDGNLARLYPTED